MNETIEFLGYLDNSSWTTEGWKRIGVNMYMSFITRCRRLDKGQMTGHYNNDVMVPLPRKGDWHIA